MGTALGMMFLDDTVISNGLGRFSIIFSNSLYKWIRKNNRESSQLTANYGSN